jgi:NAD(P)H-dependent flavin oxidoreductase YrpB (nitropropane dioxygenase family)
MSVLDTPLCELLGIEIPILQAGMGRARGSPTTVALVVAVSETGGLGCLGATGMEPEEIRAAIHEIRSLTSRPFGVDLLLPARLADAGPSREEVRRQIRQDHPEHWRFVLGLYERFGLDPDEKREEEWVLSPTLVRRQTEVLVEERVPVFVSGLGDPAWVVPLAREAGMKVMGLCGSPRNAERQRAAGVDAVIAQGHEAGGHTGSIATMTLVPQVVDRVHPTPVVAAGGIVDGRGVAAALALGAQGVWCGTAFLFADEIDLFPAHRDQLVAAETHQLAVGRSYTGKPSRVVTNEVTEAWRESRLDPLPMPHQAVLMDDFTYAAEVAGRHELVNNPAGQAAGMLDRYEPAAVIAQRLATQAVEVIERLRAYVEGTEAT